MSREQYLSAVGAFVKVWADTAYYKAPYHEQRRFLREGAATVAAPLLGLSPDALLERMTAETVPWLGSTATPGSKRYTWWMDCAARLIVDTGEEAA